MSYEPAALSLLTARWRNEANRVSVCVCRVMAGCYPLVQGILSAGYSLFSLLRTSITVTKNPATRPYAKVVQ